MSPENKARYRRLRNGGGFLLGCAWIVYWYTRLESQQAAEFAALGGCDALSGLKWATCSAANGAERGAISFAFGVKTMLAVATAPFAFLVSHYVARSYVKSEESAAEASDAAAAREARQQAETSQRERMAASEAAAQSVKDSSNRAEFIQKLGAVSDLLALLTHEADKERILLIQQSISKELRELIAKYPLPILERMVCEDEAITLTLKDALGQLNRASLRVDSVVVLERALGRAAAA